MYMFFFLWVTLYKANLFSCFRFSHVHLSDVLRLALVYKYGGLYIDTDIWAKKRIDLTAKYLARASGGMISESFVLLLFIFFSNF